MTNHDRKVRVVAVNNYKVESKFDIYLEFPGRREWLMIHRRNGILYNLLRNPVPLGELRRIASKGRNNLKYLVKVIDEYLKELENV